MFLGAVPWQKPSFLERAIRFIFVDCTFSFLIVICGNKCCFELYSHGVGRCLPLVPGLGCAGVLNVDGRVPAGVVLLPLPGLTVVAGVGMVPSPNQKKKKKNDYKVTKLLSRKEPQV